jgi:hypothetical protein
VRIVGTGNSLYGLDEIDDPRKRLKENVAGLRMVNLGNLLGCLAFFAESEGRPNPDEET